MVKYRTTAAFIRICAKGDNLRYNALCKNIRIDKKLISQNWDDIKRILDFVGDTDKLLHRSDKYGKRDTTFFGTIFNSFIVNDLRTIIILSITGQHNQSNMVIRHLIENLVYSLWADLISKFTFVTEYLLYPEEWRPYRKTHKIIWNPDDKNYPQRSIRERLERIRLINLERKEGTEFYKKYFRKATGCDIHTLLSLPVCSSCMQKTPKNYTKFHTSMDLRKRGKEDIHAYYKTDFGYHCCFCNTQKLTKGFAMGIPDFDNMIEMLAEALVYDSTVSERLRSINQLYSYLSGDFIHFSTTALPDSRPNQFNTTSGVVTFWGFEGINFCIRILGPILAYYFKQLMKKTRA